MEKSFLTEKQSPKFVTVGASKEFIKTKDTCRITKSNDFLLRVKIL